MAKQSTPTNVETITHDDAKRKNIPTAEYQSVLDDVQKHPKQIRYPRNTDLDPQLVWRGKDEQDWSDLVVHAPPLYIQEKVHPKVLIDELLRETNEREHEQGQVTPDLFADFNGIPKDADKTEFYQHDQNWSNRMILGDSLQVMASLAEREGLRGKVQCIYLDPPYVGTSTGRDRRYASGLDSERLAAEVASLRARGAAVLISYDGETGGRSYAPPLPESLRLERRLLDAGRSSQATLLGRDERTLEALYLGL